MDFIDLHTHSNASDGTFTPTQVINRAIEKELYALSLTDHDTIDGIWEAIEASKSSSLEFIPGIELSCCYDNREIHILGLFINHEDTHFQQELIKIRTDRLNRNLEMIEHFQRDNINVTLEKLQAGNPNSVITRAHFARVLMEEGVCKTKDQAFNRYIGINCPYYIPREMITPEYAISLIKKAGGKPILAHPLLYKLSYSQIEAMLVTFMEYGLVGIEAYHSSSNWYETDKLRSFALKYNLGVSGGSDFHGQNKPDIDIGSGRGSLRIHKSILEKLRTY